MKKKFNQHAGLIRAHSEAMRLCSTHVRLNVPEEEFIPYIRGIFRAMSDNLEHEHIMKFREQIDNMPQVKAALER